MDEPKVESSALPPVVGRAAFQAELDGLRAREKAHTREGDAIAAARRRLPMVEVDPSLTLTGPGGPLPLLDAFEGRRQLIAYFFMWWDGHPAAGQCEGCTWVTGPRAAAQRPWTTATRSWTDRVRTPGAVGRLASRLAATVLHHAD